MSPRMRDEDLYEFIPDIRPSRLHIDEHELLFTRVYDANYSNTSVERMSYRDMQALYRRLGEFFDGSE